MNPRKQVATCPNPKCAAVLPSLLATCHEPACLPVEVRDEVAAKRRGDL